MIIKGIPASKGIAICEGFVIESENLEITDELVDNPKTEIVIFEHAIKQTIKELHEIRNKTAIDIDEKHAMIFDAYIEFADDPDIRDQVIEFINKNKYNSAYALKEVSKTYLEMFLNMEEGYFKDRVDDFNDVMRRITSNILGNTKVSFSNLNEKRIIIAGDLSPSDTALLDKENVIGIVTNVGSATSHIAIMAKTLGIPAVIGTKNITDVFKTGDIVIIDGFDGNVIINPSKDILQAYKLKKKQYILKEKARFKFVNKESISNDGKKIEIAANIGNPFDIKNAIKNGAEGIGLYRTEFLYMDKPELPSEEQQFRDYKYILESMKNKKVVIRTLDIGGDKQLKYLPTEKELNPFLGKRAIRLCLDNIPLFKTQLRALLRASIYGDLNIMFPMIATLNELRKAKEILQECEEELHIEGYKTSSTIKIGIMVEIPSVAILADKFAKEVDFFSIGTNDLIQYTFAADRMNENVAYLYQPLNPSILRLIKTVVDAGHKQGIWIGVCGEAAASENVASVLLGLGVDELSMNSASILNIRSMISRVSYKELNKLAVGFIDMETHEEVEEIISKYLEKIY